MFKTWLENSVKVLSYNTDGSKIRIAYPSGIYDYESPHYAPLVLSLIRKNKYTPGRLSNDLKKMVNNGLMTSQRIQ